MNPREESVTADWRVETDGPSVFNVASGTMSPFTAQTWQALAVESGSCFRLLLSSSAIRTITPLLEGAEVMKFVNADSELWPELRHNRR